MVHTLNIICLNVLTILCLYLPNRISVLNTGILIMDASILCFFLIPSCFTGYISYKFCNQTNNGWVHRTRICLHRVLTPLKRKGNKWPTKRQDLIALYPQVKDRAPLEFEIDPIVNNDDENVNQINDDDSNTGTNDDNSFTDFAMI